jgi:ribosomal protein S18 acetylase RimI-like enzyme
VYLQQQADTLYLGMLSVNPVLQGAGIGKYLLQTATDYAQEIGCRRLKITVLSVRAELLAWYERHGYRRTGEALPFQENPAFGTPRQPLTLLVLEKVLAA